MNKVPKKFKHHIAGRGGWSEWVFPSETYFFKCCDCELVHEIQFKAYLERKRKGNSFEVVPMPKEIRPMFRARRAK